MKQTISGSIPSNLINLTNLSNLSLGSNCLSTDVSDPNLLNFLNTKAPSWISTQNACGVTNTTATLLTSDVSAITYNSAISGGNIVFDGNCSVTARGVCYATSPNPTISNTCTSDSSGTGVFASILNGMVENTTYYVRAYATNCQGTSYGNQIAFTTQVATTSPQTISFRYSEIKKYPKIYIEISGRLFY